jgi:hypothetical protein
VPKGKAVKALIKNPKVRKQLDRAKLGGAAVLAEKGIDIVDNPILNTAQGAAIGFGVGGVPGAIVGGGLGYLIGDQYITFPMPMIAIPAHESHLLNGSPSMQVYIRAGETLVPTGGNVQDMNLGVAQAEALENENSITSVTNKKKPTAYQRKYKKAFAKVKPKHMNKNGKWKKDGFKRAVKEAHRMCK